MDLLAALHYDYTLPKGVERHATGNYGILDNETQARKAGRQRPTHSKMSPSATPRPAVSGMQRTDAVQGFRVKRQPVEIRNG
jgi:hypothetical protein